jgi:hypothetical protein
LLKSRKSCSRKKKVQTNQNKHRLAIVQKPVHCERVFLESKGKVKRKAVAAGRHPGYPIFIHRTIFIFPFSFLPYHKMKIPLFILFILITSTAFSALPLDPAIKTATSNGSPIISGKTPNPKPRTALIPVNKVGSIRRRRPAWPGVLHEHMSFNGTQHFPGNDLAITQQSGVRFGADLNAYTSFDERCTSCRFRLTVRRS